MKIGFIGLGNLGQAICTRLASLGDELIVYNRNKRGLAKKLLEYSFENLSKDNKDFSLEVKVSNESAISLYKKYGFEIKKVLKDYYEQCDGYLMHKKKTF